MIYQYFCKKKFMWTVSGLLILVGVVLIGYFYTSLKLDKEIAGNLSAAFIGLGAALIAVLADRGVEWQDSINRRNEEISKIKSLVTAELVNVSCGLLTLKDNLDVAIETLKVGGSADFKDLPVPRPMPFTDSLSSTILLLSEKEIDVLSTLKNSLHEFSLYLEKHKKFYPGFITGEKIRSEMYHNLELLAQAFEEFAPIANFNFHPIKSPSLLQNI